MYKILILILSLSYVATTTIEVRAACRTLIEAPATRDEVEAYKPIYSIHSVDFSHPRIREIIGEVLKLQKTLLINRLPLEQITKEHVQNGFLVGESTFDSVMESLTEHQGKLVLVCTQDDADTLAGYAVLTGMSDLRGAVESEEIAVFEPNFERISMSSWKDLISDQSQMRYIHQIAVHPEMRGMGIGSLLVAACKISSPKGVAADILFWPEPFNNVASYSMFLKRGFTDVGSLHIKTFPAFKECKTHVVVWTPGVGS